MRERFLVQCVVSRVIGAVSMPALSEEAAMGVFVDGL